MNLKILGRICSHDLHYGVPMCVTHHAFVPFTNGMNVPFSYGMNVPFPDNDLPGGAFSKQNHPRLLGHPGWLQLRRL